LYEIAIVGGGPAGLAAAVNARQRNKKVVLISKEEHSSKLAMAHQIDNFLGINQITGLELAEKLRAHAEAVGTVFIKDEIQKIAASDEGGYQLWGRENLIEAKVVILAVGVALGSEISGENEYIGRGVSYCATCDGMFYKGKKVAMLGYIPEAEGEAAFLAEVASQVYYLPLYKVKNSLDERFTVISGKPQQILGEKKVQRLVTSQGEWEVDGVFIERASLPLAQLIADLELQAEMIYTTSEQETNLPGVFAAGDCTGKPWQINRAIGQGQVAALNAVQYLQELGS